MKIHIFTLSLVKELFFLALLIIAFVQVSLGHVSGGTVYELKKANIAREGSHESEFSFGSVVSEEMQNGKKEKIHSIEDKMHFPKVSENHPSSLAVLDVALRKTILSPSIPAKVGNTVVFSITVTNQGTAAIDSVQIVDYLPAGLLFNALDNPQWTGSAPSVYYTATVANGLLPAGGIASAASISINLTLKVSSTATADNLDNFAEISGVRDVMGNVNVDDIDSNPDKIKNNDAGGQINSPADNYLAGNGMGTPGDGVAATDEDDHDGARVRFADLSLVKVISPTTAPPYLYGSPVMYTLTVSNQSNEAVKNIEIQDVLPSGFSFSPNNGWVESSTGIISNNIAGPLAPGASATVNLELVLIPSNQPNAWLNFSEIMGFEDMGGSSIGNRDFDSNPGNGPSGGAEDDDDIEVIEIFDLALRKTLLTAPPHAYGQLLTFRIEVFNQGNVPVTNVIVKDYLSNGYSYVANNGWTGTYPNLQNSIAGPIAPGGSATLELQLTLQNSPDGSYNNYAEIAAGDAPSGPGFDADSNPDSDTAAERDVEPGDPDDDNIYGGGLNVGEDEDDHDPAGMAIFDLALRKTVDTALPSYSYGQDVMYRITIYNQGNIAARDIQIRDTIPCGFEFNPSDPANSGWSRSGDIITYTISTVLNPGQFKPVSVRYIVRPCYTNPSTAWTNYAEIRTAINEDTSLPGDDIDSTPDDNMDNDSGGVPDFNGVMSGTDNTINNESGDEDDHDSHKIQVFDLALRKKLTTGGPFNFGQLLTFTMELFNQGNVTAKNIMISDYAPEGYSFVNNNGWTSIAPGLLQRLVSGPLAPGTSTNIPLQLTLVTATNNNSWDNYAEVSASKDDQDNNRNDDADSILDMIKNNDFPVLPGDTNDDKITGLGPNAGQDEDDHDPAKPVIVDIALEKIVTTAGPYSYGQTVSYVITLTNEGTIPLRNIEVKDALPCGMTYAGGSQPWTINGNEVTTTYTGTLQPSATTSISITVTLRACTINPSSAWTNIAQVVSMEDGDGDDVSNDDVDSSPNNNDPSEDDQDEETLNIFDLALRKILLTPLPYTYGQLLTFRVEVYNQGNIPATNIVIKDYIPDGYSYATNNGWTGTYPNLQNIIAGPILPGGSATLQLQLTLKTSPNGSFNNYAEIAAANGPSGPGFDADSNPDSDTAEERNVKPGDPDDNNINGGGPNAGEDEDDHDPSGVLVFDLALTKVATTAAPSYSYGQVVTYEIKIYNQGNIAARNIQITDYLPCGLVFNPASANNGNWTAISAGRLSRTLPGVLNAGQSISIFLDLTVTDCYTNPSTAWTNYAEISTAINVVTGLPGLDIDSNPDAVNGNDAGGVPDFNGVLSGTDNTINNQNGDEDDHDPHQIQVFDLALRKVVNNRGPYTAGQTATFRITVFNQGNVTATNIVVNDYIRRGFTFPANPGWSMIAAPTSSTNGLLQYTITGPLSPGQSQEIILNLTVAQNLNPATTDWHNYAEIGSSRDNQGNNRDDDADSAPNTNSAYENQVVPDSPFDNVINGNGPLVSEDEDDHDPDMIFFVSGLGDRVWKDINGNGIQDSGEPGIKNVIARLQDCSGNTLAVTLTDDTGFYFFNNLLSGNYRVQFDVSGILAGCQYTLQNQGGDDETDSDVDINGLGPCINLNAGAYDNTYDAGLLQLAEIGDYVWHDLNGNGIQNSGEPGIANVRVELYRADGTLYGVKFTNANGYYLFNQLYPGDYYLKFISPAGFELTQGNQGSSDSSDSDVDGSNGKGTTATTTISSGESDMTWDAGFYICIPVGEVVWYDFNKNDVRDNFENGINGLKVSIYRRVGSTWQLFDSMYSKHKPGTPSDDGYWKFCVPPGTYYVHVDMPPLGLVRVRPNVGNDPNRDSDLTNANGPMTTGNFTVLSGEMKCDIGAGFYPMAMTGNLVWIDENLNGLQDFTEEVVEGVIVQAKDALTHEVLSSAETDHNGQYELDYLEKRPIYIRFELPSELNQYVPTIARNGQDHQDSDVDGSFGPRTTRMINAEPSMMNMDIDMGIVLGALPVDWLNVSAVKTDKHHLVTWATAREVNASHYIVERKMGESTNFIAVSESLKASGYSLQRRDYKFEDNDNTHAGLYTYRVKQVDFDGSFTYSREVTIQQNLTHEMQIYPNPAKDVTNVSIQLATDATVSLAVYDDAGALVRTIKTNEVMESGQYAEILNLQNLPSGVYNLKILINGEQWQKKIVIVD